METFHKEQLDNHCRVCGNRLPKGKYSRECYKYSDLLKKAHGIECDSRDEACPQNFCAACYQRATRICAAKDKGAHYESSVQVVKWAPHKPDNCSTCDLFSRQCQGGRPRKEQKKRGRPGAASTHTYWRTINSLGVHVFRATMPLALSRFHTSSAVSIEDFQCPVCCNVVDGPVQVSCGALVCGSCLVTCMEEHCEQCPCCGGDHSISSDSLRAPPEVVTKVLGSLAVECERPGCHCVVRLDSLAKHLEENCNYTPPLQRDATLGEVLSQAPDTPATHLEKQVASKIVQRMLSESPDDTAIQLPTGGQPIRLVKVRRGRVTTSDASSKTVHRRCLEMSSVRAVVSGGASSELLHEEVHALTKDERQALLADGGFGVEIPPEKGLAMKADLAIPWSKLRIIRRWLKASGVTMGSERRMRKAATEMVGANLLSEAAPLSFSLKRGGEEIRAAPLVYVPDLGAKVLQLLEQNEKNGRLVHHEMIPEGEEWLKLGGDKGGGSFKMSFQLGGISKPNSVHNTCVFTIFNASDTPTNLHIALVRYKDQVSDLKTLQWRGKNFRIFLFGDYELLGNIYGITGANGRHCCLWCVVTYSALQSPRESRGRSPARSLATLRADYQRFCAAGGNIKKAKLFNNVIHESLFDIPLSQACPPGLHISLGIFQRLFDLLEAECHKLDLQYAQQYSKPGDPTSFAQYASNVQQLTSLREQVSQVQQHSTWLEQQITYLSVVSADPDGPISVVREEAVKSQARLRDLEKQITQLKDSSDTTFVIQEGPFVRCLDAALASFHVERQAYHGGSFIGNHVHRCLKSCPDLVPGVQAIGDKFERALLLFSRCHNLYNRADYVSDNDADELGKAIDKWLHHYRTTFPSATILPKMHFLEDHAVDFIKKWHTGFGFLGEQGCESIHAVFNQLLRTYNNIPNKVDRLYHMVREHHLRLCPDNLKERPEPAKRKKLEPEA